MATAADPGVDRAGAVFAALADLRRRRIVHALSTDGPLTATQLAPAIGISRQATSKHLFALADAGLATGERVGRETRFELDTRPFAEAESWMRVIGAHWDQRLHALNDFLERESLLAEREDGRRYTARRYSRTAIGAKIARIATDHSTDCHT
jgi:DNA-binding transcriptional ArsR family regulator